MTLARLLLHAAGGHGFRVTGKTSPVIGAMKLPSVVVSSKKPTVGADGYPPSQGNPPLQGALGIVVGSESEGLRPLVKSKCDFLLRLPMQGQIESLNAAVAGSVVLYLAYFARQKLEPSGHPTFRLSG